MPQAFQELLVQALAFILSLFCATVLRNVRPDFTDMSLKAQAATALLFMARKVQLSLA